MRKKIIDSLIGISMGSYSSGEQARVRTIFNCKTPCDQDFVVSETRKWLDTVIYPEIYKKIRENRLSPNFRLRKAHIVMYGNENHNKILLNRRAKFLALIKPKEQKDRQPNDLLYSKDIEDVLGLYPSKKNNPNAAHIMLFRTDKGWHLAFDFTYNLERGLNLLEKLKKEIEIMQELYKQQKKRALIKILWKLNVRITQAWIMTTDYTVNFRREKNLGEIFVNYKNNIDVKFYENYITLWNLRKQGLTNDTISTITDEQVKKLLETTAEYREMMYTRLINLQSFRACPPGLYIN
ncbi:MAG TPA: hypothetical protein VFG45_03415 [Candidatus Nitrosocosmicus sp.]|nr:hypothetical protein [Candidatus Nitrosocosmicus sp.]